MSTHDRYIMNTFWRGPWCSSTMPAIKSLLFRIRPQTPWIPRIVPFNPPVGTSLIRTPGVRMTWRQNKLPQTKLPKPTKSKLCLQGNGEIIRYTNTTDRCHLLLNNLIPHHGCKLLDGRRRAPGSGAWRRALCYELTIWDRWWDLTPNDTPWHQTYCLGEWISTFVRRVSLPYTGVFK
jgi:hypothetical protein